MYTFYLRLYSIGDMLNDHSYSDKGLLFLISSKGSFICTIPPKDSTYHSLCYTSRRALAGTRNQSMDPPHEGSIWRPITPWANGLTTELHLPPPFQPMLCSWCKKGWDVYYHVCGMVHIKDPLQVIRSPWSDSSGFPLSPSEWSIIIHLTSRNRKKNCWVHR